MAATSRQTLANRLNALRSTGPRTPEGKARSSRNALKHGLSRIGSRPPAELADAIAERLESWRQAYRPDGPAEEWAFGRLVAESVRLDFCEARLLAARAEHAARAADAAALAARLPAHPERIQPRLLQSKHGVRWMLDRWDELADSLARHAGWTREAWQQALDLLGLPLHARDGSGPWDLDPDDRSEAPGLALVASATAALRDRLEAYLDARDARARSDAEAGLDADDPPPIRLLERYAADARRRIMQHTNELRRLQAQRARTLESSPSGPTAAPPGPRPERSSARSRPEPAPAERPPDAPSPPARNEPAPEASRPGPSPRREAWTAPTPPLNRRARRALAAAARRRS